MSKAENPNQIQEIKIISINQREIELLEKNRKINLQKLFTPEGMDSMIVEIQREVADFSADITTKEGRAKIVSMAAKVAKCKSPIKSLASELKEESRRLIDGVNAQWNRYEKAMDELRDEIRKPLDEIEEREAAILKSRQDQLKKIEDFKTAIYTSSEASKLYAASIEEVKKFLQFDWGNDWAFRAETAANEVIAILEERFAGAKKYEEDQAELAKLKKEAAERAQKDHEEKIAREAAEKAKRDAEAQIEKAAKEKKEAEERAIKAELEVKTSSRKQDLLNLGMIYDQAQDAFTFNGLTVFFKTVIALSDRHWNEEFHEIEYEVEKHKKAIAEENRIAAEKKAKEDVEKAAAEAVEKERQRVADEAEKERLAEEKREKNKRHRAKINNEILAALKIITAKGIEANDHELEKAIVEAIAEGEVPHVQINY